MFRFVAKHQNICVILVRVISFTLSGKDKKQENGPRDNSSLFTFTLYLVVGLKLGTKDIQVPFFKASLLPLNNFRHA